MILTTTREIIDVLGGTKAVVEMTGVGNTSVSNWRVSGKFPAKFHLLMTSALDRKHYEAPASLWGVPEYEEN